MQSWEEVWTATRFSRARTSWLQLSTRFRGGKDWSKVTEMVDSWAYFLSSLWQNKKNNWSSGSLYLKQQKYMYIYKAWQKKVVGGPQLGNSYPYRQQEECHDCLMDGSAPVLMFWRCYLTCDTNSEFEGKTYLGCLHNTLALPAPKKSHTFLKLFPAPLHLLPMLVITGSQFHIL